MGNNGNNLRRFGRYEIDLDQKILWLDNSPADLPVKAVELLCVLIENEGKVVSKDELLETVWLNSFVEEGVLPQNVYLLRKTFRDHGLKQTLIQTVPRRGYRFLCDDLTVARDESVRFEREVIEETYIAQTELAVDEPIEMEERQNDPLVAAKPLSGLDKRGALSTFSVHGKVVLSLTVVVVIALGVLGLLFIFPKFSVQEQTLGIASNFGNLQYDRVTASGRAFYVGLSPDNQNVAYVVHTSDNKYSLVLHHLPSKSETVIIAPQELHLYNVHFSPDGNYIYYGGGQGTKKPGVYRIPIYGGTGQLITTEPVHHFSVSPDGNWLAYYRRVPEEGAHYLEMCRSSDGSDKRVVTKRDGGAGFSIWGASPSWSPDGSKFIAAVFTPTNEGERHRIHLVEIDAANGIQTEVKAPDWYGVHQPYWSADARRIFVMAREKVGDTMQLWDLDHSTGEARMVTNDNNNYREFRVSSDGSFIVSATWSKSENLYTVPVAGSSAVRQLTFDSSGSNGAWGLKWTVDGKSLLFTRGEGVNIGNVWKLELDSLQSTQLTFDSNTFPHSIETTPDGRSALFVSNRTKIPHIWQVELDGTNLRQITSGSGEAAPEISPDNEWLYYVQSGLWKMPFGGGEPIRIMEASPRNPQISPTDPSMIAAGYFDPNEKENNPWKYVLFSDNDTSNFIDLKVPAINFNWKSDGRGIYYADNGESFSNIWFVSIDTLEATRITSFTDQKISNFSVSPDGKKFAISRGSAIGNIIKIGLQK